MCTCYLSWKQGMENLNRDLRQLLFILLGDFAYKNDAAIAKFSLY